MTMTAAKQIWFHDVDEYEAKDGTTKRRSGRKQLVKVGDEIPVRAAKLIGADGIQRLIKSGHIVESAEKPAKPKPAQEQKSPAQEQKSPAQEQKSPAGGEEKGKQEAPAA